MTSRAACRNRRATRCRCTADPTDRETISPTFGASAVVPSPRRTYITRSGCTARVPCLTVASKSVDRVMRFRAESTAVTPGLKIKQSASGVPCDADRTRSPGPPWYASAAGTRARANGAGYSAERSACPWPRLSPRCIWHRVPTGTACRRVTLALTKPGKALCLAGIRRGPRAKARIAAESPTFGRLYEGTDRCSPGQTTPVGPSARPRYFTATTPATGPLSNLEKAFSDVAERLAQSMKTVSFGQCRFRPERRSTTKQEWQIGNLVNCTLLTARSTDPACRR
jgi:hypothetical protein